MRDQAAETILVSCYHHQRSSQQALAADLGFNPPTSMRLTWNGQGAGVSFYYRSCLFLALAAVVAHSWGTQVIYQFENGVLATAMPPTPNWRMTRHAHPLTQHHSEQLFHELLGGDWEIRNPFLSSTKLEVVQRMKEAISPKKATGLAQRTETCWYYRQARVFGVEKKPNQPCGVCVPCLVRRTALPKEKTYFDILDDDSIRNDDKLGAAVRDYTIFVKRVLQTKNRPREFYRLLPGNWREFLYGSHESSSPLTLDQLHKLFLNFAKEFKRVFRLR